MFSAFTLIVLVLGSLLSYMNQMSLYKQQREESIQYVANYIESRIIADGLDFRNFQKYFIAHSGDLRIRPNFDQNNVDRDRELYETLFAQKYPGKSLYYDIKFDDLTEDIKKIYTIYAYKYYALLFEEAAKSFNLAYTYYVTPGPEPDTMYWSIFSLREATEINGQTILLLNALVPNSHTNNPQMWEAWDTGKRPSGYKIYDNEYGKTYAYYTPLFIQGEKLGVIGVEVEIDSINKAILHATIRQIIMIGGILILFTAFLLFLIRYNYIRKLVKLRNIIEIYSNEKDHKIAESLKVEVTNEDEISQLMEKFSDMIYQLELYIHNLKKTKQDLQTTRQHVIELNELAVKDSLTGIRNKTGYDKALQNISWEMGEGLTEIGAAMIDLNFLKRTNDTYGHDNGDMSIVLLSRIICHIFAHSAVFRIGGDEFVVILKDHDLKYIKDLVKEFERKLKELKTNRSLAPWERISAAIGYAIFDPETDSSFESILKRAMQKCMRQKKR